MNSRRLSLSIVALVLFAVIGYMYVTARETPRLPSIVATKLSVKKLRILSGHEFDITLEDGKRFCGNLPVKTPTGPGSDVAKKVSDLLNASTNPKVVVLKKEASVWIVELYLTKDGKELRLSEWLKQNKLVWE